MIERVIFGFVVIALCVASGFAAGWMHRDKEFALFKDRVSQEAAAAKAYYEIMAEIVEEDQVKVQEKIKVVFKDRIVERVKYEKVYDDSACDIPNRFVCVWNDANSLRTSNPSCLLDGSPSGVELVDVEAQHDREAEACHSAVEQVKGWQQWYRNLEKRDAAANP